MKKNQQKYTQIECVELKQCLDAESMCFSENYVNNCAILFV